MTTVITGFSPAGRIEYGQRFLDTFVAYWPEGIRLQCYCEEPTEIPRDGFRDLWRCRDLRAFIDGNKNNKERIGCSPSPNWKPGAIAKGYNYRFDAVKFSRQCFIPEQAALELPDGEIMAWLDADVVTFNKVPPDLIDRLVGEHELVFLGRGEAYSELGFWAIRLNAKTRRLVVRLADLFRSGEIFTLKEWHSAYAFDHVRKRFSAKGGDAFSLTDGHRGAHVWFQTELAKYTDHLKGKRKALGYSPEAKVNGTVRRYKGP